MLILGAFAYYKWWRRKPTPTLGELLHEYYPNGAPNSVIIENCKKETGKDKPEILGRVECVVPLGPRRHSAR